MEAGPHQDFIRCGSMRVFCDQCRRERKCLREKSRRERKKIAARYAQAATLILFSETASRGDAEGAAGKLVEGSKSETAPSKSEKIPRLKLFSGEARRLEADEAERTNAAGERERLRVQKAELDSLWALAAQREQINKMFSEKPEPQAADQARCCRGSIQVNNDDVQTSEKLREYRVSVEGLVAERILPCGGLESRPYTLHHHGMRNGERCKSV
ncbi:hypothetical protein MMC28_004600 [Mycoblastus sanguinarius]|nr:hypothetical protein [Mycoblastus sanguinarius]